MTDRPILFGAPMVRAILDGRKGQTRRALKAVPPAPSLDSLVHPPKHEAPYFDAYCGGRKSAANPRGMTDQWCWWTRDDRAGHGCKVGFVPGDRLWVREAWRVGYGHDWYREDLGRTPKPGDYDPSRTPVEYLADGQRQLGGREHPSIQMPRWASRLTLTVTDVRVERLQDISEADARAEGLLAFPDAGPPTHWAAGSERDDVWHTDPRHAYAALWNAINGPSAWEANPWVVAISFDAEQRNIDAPTEGGAHDLSKHPSTHEAEESPLGRRAKSSASSPLET